MKKIVINGIFTCSPLTGVERVAFGLLEELDKICGDMNIEIIVPEHAQTNIKYENIKVIKYGKKKGPLWVQFDYVRYVRRNKGITLGLGTYMPFFFKNDIVWLYDIRDVVMKDCAPLRYRIMTTISCYFRCHWSKHIVTGSLFSKNEILNYYKVPEKKISVLYPGWQHFSENTDMVLNKEKYPDLEEKKYYFYLGSIVKHKNLKWVLEVAKRNPDDVFVISGMQIERLKSNEQDDFRLNNVHYLGYLNDDDVKMIMKHCKAFIFPSLYEGFGIPPLEALSLSAPVIASKIPVHLEIYGSAVHYIDPYDYDVDLDGLLAEKTAPAETVLSKYSYKKSAEQLLRLLREYSI